MVTDRPDLRSLVAAAAATTPGTRLVTLPAADAAAVPAGFDAAVLGVDALPALAAAVPAGRPVRRCRLAVVAAEGDDLSDAWPAALTLGAETLAVPGRGGDLASWLSALAPGSPGAVGVVGGRGGAGASSAAVALARAAAAGPEGAVLVDADPLGGGLDLALGAEAVAGLRWPDLDDAQGASPGGLLAALPAVDGVTVVSHSRDPGGRPPDAALTVGVLDSCLAAGGTVVVDLPRGSDPAVHAALSRCSLLVVVVPAEVRACAAASALLDRLGTAVDDVRLLVRGPSAAGLTAEDVAAAVGVPAFAEVRPEPGLAAALDRGEPVAVSPRSPLRTWATGLLEVQAAAEHSDRRAPRARPGRGDVT